MKKPNTRDNFQSLRITQTDVRILQDKLFKIKLEKQHSLGAVVEKKHLYKSRVLSKVVSKHAKILAAIELLEKEYPYLRGMKGKGGVYAK